MPGDLTCDFPTCALLGDNIGVALSDTQRDWNSSEKSK